MSGMRVPSVFLVLAAAMLWGTTGTAQALGPDGIDPLVVGSARQITGGVLLGGFVLLRGGWHEVLGLPRTALGIAAGCAAAYQLCFFAGVQRAGVAVGTVVAIGSAPVFTGLLSGFLGQGRPSPRWGVATLCAVAGCTVLITGGGGAGQVSASGVILALGAGLAYAALTVTMRTMVTRASSTVCVAAVTAAAGVLVAPVLVARLATGGAGGGVGVLAVIVYLGLVPTALAYALYAKGLAGLNAPVVATLTLAETVVAATLGVTVLAEPVTPARAGGALLVLAGLVVLVTRRRPAARA